MPKKRFSSEHIIAKLREIEVQLAQGKSIALACKGAAISEQSARALVDTPVQAHSRHAASQFAEDRGCSSDKGVHTLSACGGQGGKTAAAPLSRRGIRGGLHTQHPSLARTNSSITKPAFLRRLTVPLWVRP